MDTVLSLTKDDIKDLPEYVVRALEIHFQKELGILHTSEPGVLLILSNLDFLSAGCDEVKELVKNNNDTIDMLVSAVETICEKRGVVFGGAQHVDGLYVR